MSSRHASVVEKLEQLRAFVGDSFSETDLQSCLSKSSYVVDLAAEKLITGQYKPTKRFKASPQSSQSSSSRAAAAADSKSPATPQPSRPKQAVTRVTNRAGMATKVATAPASRNVPVTKEPSPAMASRYKTPTKQTPSHAASTPLYVKKPLKSYQGSWLLCARWIGDCVCTARGGSVDYKERLDVDFNATGQPLVRFRGSRIQGQFPKHLTHFFSPLLRDKHDPIAIEAEGLMEGRGLSIGSELPVAIRVWIQDPQQFFALFDTMESSSKSNASMFFRKKAAQAKRTKIPTVHEAAFALLQWAQHGESLPVLDKAQENRQSDDSSDLENDENGDVNGASLDEEHDLVADLQDEDDVPEWAKTITSSQDAAIKHMPEMEDPADLKVELRSYQKQALHWLLQRELNGDSAELKEQLDLLMELSRQKTSSNSLPATSKQDILCECGPVLLRDDVSRKARSIDGGDAEKAQLSHPLWERRYLASHDMKQARCFFVQSMFRKAKAYPPAPPKPCRGGILADSMGLGKTVMLLALISKTKEIEDPDDSGPTLIVAPLSLLRQWESEIETKTALSIKVHYADKKVLDFDAHDVVATTYGSLQGEVHSFLKRKALDEGARPTGLLAHEWKRVILDEAHFVKNQSTLISKGCCMLKAERRWCVSGTIIQNSLNDVYGLLKFLRHEPWCENSFWKASIGKVEDMQLSLDRVRRLLRPIMLRRTKHSMDKYGKPILTLPPIEMKTVAVQFSSAEREFYSALHQKSLNLFQGFIKKGTASKSWLAIFSLLHRLRLTCDHVALTVKSHLDQQDWNTQVGKVDPALKIKSEHNTPSQESANIDNEYLNNLLDKFKVMQKITNDEDQEQTREQQLSYAHHVVQKFRDAVEANSSQLAEECSICLEEIQIDDAVVTPCLHIFCKKCLSSSLREKASLSVVKTTTNDDDDDDSKNQSDCCPDGPCPVCSMDIVAERMLDLSQFQKLQIKPPASQTTAMKIKEEKIPVAASFDEDDVLDQTDVGARQVLKKAVQGTTSSAKLNAIVSELHSVWDVDPCSKVLVFSQFLGFLDLLEKNFRENDIPFSRLDGKLSLKERVKVLNEFGEPLKAPSILNNNETSKVGSVLLISMKAGGVGLNLVAAHSVFIADPWWHASMEDQCIDRIHRIGQTADTIRVRKFYVENSVEERIIALQKRKKAMANNILRDNNKGGFEDGNQGRPNLDELKILFQD